MNEKEDILHNGRLEGLRDYQVFRRRTPGFKRYNTDNIKAIDHWHFKICKNNNPRLPYRYWLSVVGHLRDGTVVQSSPIVDIETPRIVVTENSRYRLEANSEIRKLIPHESFSREELNKFLNGFPRDWVNIIRVELEKTYGSNLYNVEGRVEEKEVIREIDKLYEEVTERKEKEKEHKEKMRDREYKDRREVPPTIPPTSTVLIPTVLPPTVPIPMPTTPIPMPTITPTSTVLPMPPIHPLPIPPTLTTIHPLPIPPTPTASSNRQSSHTFKAVHERITNTPFCKPQQENCLSKEDFFVDQAAVESLLDINRMKEVKSTKEVEWLLPRREQVEVHSSTPQEVEAPSSTLSEVSQAKATEDLFENILQDSWLIKEEVEKEQKKPPMDLENEKNEQKVVVKDREDKEDTVVEESNTTIPLKDTVVEESSTTKGKRSTPVEVPTLIGSLNKGISNRRLVTKKKDSSTPPLNSSFISLDLENKSLIEEGKSKSLIEEGKSKKKKTKKEKDLEMKRASEEAVKSYIKEVGEEEESIFDGRKKKEGHVLPLEKVEENSLPLKKEEVNISPSTPPKKESPSLSSSSNDSLLIPSSQLSTSSTRSSRKLKRKKITMPRDFKMIARKLKKENLNSPKTSKRS